MKVSDLCNSLDSLYKFRNQEVYDNCGPQIIFEEENAENILISLDIDFNVLHEALEKKCNVIITHHPLIFDPVKNLSFSNSKSRLICALVLNKISVISVHTCLDRKYPLLLANILGFKNAKVFLPDVSTPDEGFGSIGIADEKMIFSDILCRIKKTIQLDYVLYAGDLNKEIKKAVIVNGSGMSFFNDCVKLSIDILITNDNKFNYANKSELFGIFVSDMGQFYS